MATGVEWDCPICREASGSIAYVCSCLHRFCRVCILRWATKNPLCPLCRQIVHTIIYSAPQDQGFMEMAVAVAEPLVSWSVGPEVEQDAARPQPLALVGGFLPETWAFFFSNFTEILRPLEIWLNQVLCGACWWDVAFAQGRIVASLCRYGLHEGALARELQPFLQEQTPAFVRQLIQVAADRCGELARLRMDTGPQHAGLGAVALPGTRVVVALPGTSGVVALPGASGIVALPGASGVVVLPVTSGAVALSGTRGAVALPVTIRGVALPGSSRAQEERREGRGQARAGRSGTRLSSGCGPGAFRQSGRRRSGGAPQGGGPRKAYRRQN